MRIRKNGKVIRLTESDLMRITRKVLREQDEPKFSLMDIGMDTNKLEGVLSKLIQMYKPKEDKYGTYVLLNPADFSKNNIDSKLDLSTTKGKIAQKIRKRLIDNKLIAIDPSKKADGGMMFGTKGDGKFKIYFKKPSSKKF